MNSKLILIGLLLFLFSTQVYALSDANLVAYYNFNETSGTTLIDVKDYDLNGTNTNATIKQTGKINYSYLYNGSTSKTDLASTVYAFTQNSAISFWFKNNSDTAGTLIGGQNGATGGLTIDFGTGTNCGAGKLGVTFSGIVGVCGNWTPDNDWHFVTVSLNNTGKYLYLDGLLLASSTNTTAPVSTGVTLIGLGYRGMIGDNYYAGYIDELGFWNKDLNSTEISELYNSGNGITYPFVGIASNINIEEEKIYLYDTTVLTGVNVVNWNWLVDGLSISTDQNTSFSATEFTDYNVCLIISDGNFSTCGTINSGRFYGRGFIKLYDSLNNELDQVSYVISPAINGVSSGVLADNNLNLNFTAITSSSYTFTFSKSNYTTLKFTMPLTQYTNFDYNFIILDVNKTSNVNFQVFNESGAYANTKTFYAYDYSLNKYVGIQTTDTLGRLTFNLDQTKSDYNFFSTDFNFGTTIWTINKPKDIVTLSNINGTWEYSITGPSYSNASNIAAGIQKLLLQNTVYPYLIKIVDTNKSYASTTFGLKSITSEKAKTLTPYLYKYADADLKLIKLIDFATNQPHSSSEELTLNLYTDTNGLIPIGIFVNDSTGTYNIYMDANATYELQVLSQSYNLRPTLDIYYLYLTEDIGVIIDNNLIVDVNAPIMDANLPIIFTQLREAVFGCSSTTDNCYPSMIFSLIAVALLLIVLAISGQIGAISQSITIGILLTMFLIIGFIPLWLYGVGVVILIAWGVFGQ